MQFFFSVFHDVLGQLVCFDIFSYFANIYFIVAADSSGSNESEAEEEDASSGGDVNTLLLVRILRVLEEHKAACDAQREAASAQTTSIRELLQFLRGRETDI